MSNLTLTISEIKDLTKQKVICIQMSKVMEKAALELTGNQFKLYSVLFNQVKFSLDYTGSYSLSYLAKLTNTGISTVQRNMKSLETKNLVNIKRSKKEAKLNNINEIQVTVPRAWKEELEKAQTRVNKPTYNDGYVQNEQGGTFKMSKGYVQNEQEYINNINKKTEISAPQKESNPTENIKTKPQPKFSVSFSKKQNETPQEQAKPLPDYLLKLQNSLLEKKRISKPLQEPIKKVSPQINSCTKVSPQLKAYIEHKISKNKLISSPKQVIAEIIFAVENNQLKGENNLHSVNAALKMINNNSWRTPAHFNNNLNNQNKNYETNNTSMRL